MPTSPGCTHWTLDFIDRSQPGYEQYRDWRNRISEALEFMEACGVTDLTTPRAPPGHFYTSHEALLLGFEQALTAGSIPPPARW